MVGIAGMALRAGAANDIRMLASVVAAGNGFFFLLALAVYDLRHTIIPREFVMPFIVFAGLSLFVSRVSPIGFLAGPLYAAPFALLWYFSGGRAMGLGDAFVVLGIGLLLGFDKGGVALLMAFWSGALVGLFALALPRLGSIVSLVYSDGSRQSSWRATMKSEIPFAPFLALGTAVAFFGDIGWYNLTQFFMWW